MRSGIRTLAALAALVACGGCSAGGFAFWAQVGFWDSDVESKLGQSDPRRIELQSDLGISDDPDTVIVIDAGLADPGSGRSGRPPGRYNFGFWHFSQDSSKDVGLIGVNFSGKTFTNVVSSSFKATNYVFTGEAPGQAAANQYGGTIFGIHLLNIEFDVHEVSGPNSAHMEKWVPMPVLGVRYEAEIGGGLTWYGLFEGMSLAIFDIDSFDAEFIHLDTGLKLRLGQNIHLMGGYKTWDFKVGLDDDYVKMEMKGATLVLRVEF